MSILPQLIINSIIAGAVYTILALGFNLVYGATKFFNMAHGVMAAVGGYGAFYFSQTLGWSIYLSIIFGIIIAGLTGFLVDKVVYLPLRKKKASTTILLVGSLGIFTAIQATIAILFTSQFQTLSQTFSNQKIYEISGAVITSVQLWTLVIGLLLMVILGLSLKYSRFGKAVVAISDDEEVAKIIGINTDRIIGYLFFIGSAISGLAGILIGLDTGIQPTMGMNLLLKAVIASIIGGVGNVYAGVIGAFALAFIENFGIWKITGEWKDAIAFGVLILFLLFRPQGLIKK